MIDGFLVVDKPAGISSHDVVSIVRRSFRQKKAGHTGTLDPFATGLLPVALGEATKAIPYLDESVKEYRAVMRIGATTDTLDATGTVLAVTDWSHVTAEAVCSLVPRFTGVLRQIPPMFSALKRDGVPLYKLARKGETVERAERTITVESLSIDSIALPDIAFTVRCSRGTYVRSLAADMGSALGTGAHLTALRRTSSGSFTIQDAVTIDDIVTSGPDLLSKGLMSIRCALAGLPELSLNEQGSRHVKNGIFPSDDDFEILPACWPDAGRVKLLFKGVLFAIGEPLPSDQRKIKLLRVFNLLSPLHSSV